MEDLANKMLSTLSTKTLAWVKALAEPLVLADASEDTAGVRATSGLEVWAAACKEADCKEAALGSEIEDTLEAEVDLEELLWEDSWARAMVRV